MARHVAQDCAASVSIVLCTFCALLSNCYGCSAHDENGALSPVEPLEVGPSESDQTVA